MANPGGIAPRGAVPPFDSAAAGAFLLAAAAALLPAGCRAGPRLPDDPLAQERVVRGLDPDAARAAAAAPRPRWSPGEALALAERLLAEGDARGALEAAGEGMAPGATGEVDDALREVRRRARRQVQSTLLVRGEVIASPGRVAEGEPVRVEVRLRNLAPVPLVHAAPRAGISPSTARVRVTRRARDVWGGLRVDSFEETLPLPAGRAAPGGTLEARWVLETATFRDRVPRGFVEYEFDGWVIPSGLRAGEAEVLDRVVLDPARTLAFPPGWEEVASDPAASLDRGVAARNPVLVLVAAACLSGTDRDAAGEGLARRLRDGEPLPGDTEAGVRTALRLLGGDPSADAWTPDRWRDRRLAAARLPSGGER